MKSAITLQNINYCFRDEWTRKKIVVLQDLSLAVAQGESFGFLGHNGAGKTTTIKIILGLIQRFEGRIRIFGIDSKKPQARCSVGYVPEHPYFYDSLSVQETLRFFGGLYDIPDAHLKERMQHCLELVEFPKSPRVRMRELSKGLMQKVAIAAAILNQPKLLILDEPFSGLDPLGRKATRELFASLNKEGTALFISSHILSDIELLCSRVAIIAQGRLKGFVNLKDPALDKRCYELVCSKSDRVQELLGTTAGKVTEHERYLSISVQGKEEACSLVSRIISSEIELYSFQRVRVSLEDIFLQSLKS